MIIIPARLASTRFPQKILCDIDGMPMFIRSAKNAEQIDDVVLALDSQETYDIAQKYNIKAVLTDPNIPNGSLPVLSIISRKERMFVVLCLYVPAEYSHLHPTLPLCLCHVVARDVIMCVFRLSQII